MWALATKLLANVAGQDRAESFVLGTGAVLVVADGAGGTSGAGQAAQSLVDAVQVRSGAFQAGTDVAEYLETVDRQIASTGTGQTTGVVVCLDGTRIFGASIGDSGAWLVRDDGFVDLTEGQIRKPLIGSGSARAVPFELSRNSAGTLVVASDGLFKYAASERICAAARKDDLSKIASELLGLVRLPTGGLQDDVAVLVARWRP